MLIALLAGGLLSGAALHAQDAEQPAKDTTLPMKRVVIFNSGVGFFEHHGQVNDNAEIEMKFNVDDVNDLLKSMVLQDFDGGQISTVTYGSKDPITKTLKTFAIDLTDKPTLANLLDQIRGEMVEIDAPNAVVGKVLGVEKRKRQVGQDEVIEIDYLNLLTEEGLRSVSLEEVGRIRLLNEKLDAELRQALAVLAMGHSTDKKSVNLKFSGEGPRTVSVGYVQETPVWKSSYRLVLREEGPPMLQGWAIVENTTEEDWKDVQLTLISGRPISFVMDLYEPLYVPRPVVMQELYASLRPQTYGQDLASKDKDFRRMAESGAEPAQTAAARPSGRAESMNGSFGRGGAGGAGGFGGGQPRPEADAAADGAYQLGLDRGVSSAADASNVGELFQYTIDMPVTLPRQQSAMLPIVNASVEGEKVSIYNQSVHVKHPLNGLLLKNTTGLHLLQGPVTVFDGGAYAGDAQIQDLQPDTERLISYAMDLDTEVAPESKGYPERLTSVKITKGVLISTHKAKRTQKYTIKNSGERKKILLIEQPKDAAWELIAPEEPEETTRDRYRFRVEAEPGTPVELKVEEERVYSQQVGVTSLNDSVIKLYLSAEVVSDDVKEALRRVVEMQRKVQDIIQSFQMRTQLIPGIGQEQDRIRKNMETLDRNSDLYRRYVKKFTDQEDQVETLREEIKKLMEQQKQAQKELDDYLIGLDLQ
jgi:hypothetical protein